jgi:hypothetical protein
MEPMTVSVVTLQRNKVAVRLDAARRAHGTPGRSGAVQDTTARVAKLERELGDWDRLLEFAQNN